MAKTIKLVSRHPQSLDEDDCYEVDHFEDSENEAENSKNAEQKAEETSIVVKVKRIKGGVNDELSMKIDRDVELRWLMIHYSDKVGMNKYNTWFMFNGARVRETDTPLRLSMLDNDVIYVFDASSRIFGRQQFGTGEFYRTLSIRMHKRRDTLMRVSCTVPLMPQLNRHIFHENAGKYASAYFLYNGRKVKEDDFVATLNMEDGDIIDVFDFDENSSSVKIITPINRHLKLVVRDVCGRVYYFSVMGSTVLTKLAHKYAERFKYEPEKIRFISGGRLLNLQKTVKEANLIDGCRIHAQLRFP